VREDITLFLLFTRELLTYVVGEKHHPLPTVRQRVADLYGEREDITFSFLFAKGLLTYICGGREDITLFVLLGRGLLTYYVV
jgi:hypothetical protein